MAFKKSEKRANAHHPQCVTLVIDDSGSMAEEGKCQQVTEAVQDMVITMQSLNMGTHAYRFLLNICKFGDAPTELAVAKSPPEVDVDTLEFNGGSGGTDMLLALQWAEAAVKKALERCRSIPNYQEDLAPNPICVVLSDGECTGEDPGPAAHALRSIAFKNGEVDVFAIGVGMRDEHFEAMKAIASRPEYAIKIDSEGVADFLGDVGGTVVEGTDLAHLAAKAKAR
jgi:von Willebrand factor type A domain